MADQFLSNKGSKVSEIAAITHSIALLLIYNIEKR
jgi:hypothetical protein